MFATALNAAKTLAVDGKALIPPQCLPKEYSLETLYYEVVGDDDSRRKGDELQRLLVIFSCLDDSKALVREANDANYIRKLMLWIAEAILPTGDLVPHDEMPEAPAPSSRSQAIVLAQSKGNIGLRSIAELHKLDPIRQLDSQVLLSLLAFTSSRDPWTMPSSAILASRLLVQHEVQTSSEEFVVLFLLQKFIRPLFSKSKPDTITTAGRKAMPSSAPRKAFDVVELERASRPWKYDAVYSVTVFGWMVENMSMKTATQYWHLFIPPLLTLLDETSTRLRVLGLTYTTTFLPYLNSRLLFQTGLFSVFEDAIIPTLSYLPTLTPLSESLELLPAAYAALFALQSVRFPDTERVDKERLKFLDCIMRKGILTGYQHASEHPAIVRELLTYLSTLITLLGIHSVKHLQHILPMITTTLSDPFGTANPALLLQALKTLQTLMLNAWPRMNDEGYRNETVKALVLCWRSVKDELMAERYATEMLEVEKELKVAGHMLMSVVDTGGGIDFRSELAPLLIADESLSALFRTDLPVTPMS